MPDIIPHSSGGSNDVLVGNAVPCEANLLRLTGSHREIAVDLSRVADPLYFDEIDQAVRAEGSVSVDIAFAPIVANDNALIVVEFFQALAERVQYGMRDGSQSPDLLAALLEQWNADETYAGMKDAVYFTGAIRYPNAIEMAANRIANRARELGVRGLTTSAILRELRLVKDSVLRRQQQPESSPTLTPVRSQVPDAPVPEDFVVPAEWRLTENSIVNLRDPDRSIPAVVLVRGMSSDVQTSAHRIEIAFKVNGAWRTETLPARIISETKSIIELADLGIAVTSITATDLVRFLSDFRAANRDRIPVSRTTAVMGWHAIASLFVIGHRNISAASAHAAGDLQFRHSDAGTDAIAYGYAVAGTFEAWAEIVSLVVRYPWIRFLLCASIVPPLLRIVEAENFVVDLSGETSRGKTSSLEITASGVGVPRVINQGGSGLIWSWDTTQVWRERYLVVTPDIPFFLDDSKAARFIEEIPKMVYLVTSGQERGRGTVHGTRRRASFHTVLFTTGEEPIIKLTKDGGVRPRVMTLWGSPFGEPTDETAALMRTVREGIRTSYGHFFTRFVEFIVQRCQPETLKLRYRQKVVELRRRATNERGYRLAESAATISLAADLANEGLSLPWTLDDPVPSLWDDLVGELSEGDVALDALRQVAGILLSRLSQFRNENGPSSGLEEPSGGWLGRIHDPLAGPIGDPSEAYLGVIPARLSAMLIELGFRCPDAIYREWKRRGYLIVSHERGHERTQYSTRFNGRQMRLIAIRMAALDAAGDAAAEVVLPPTASSGNNSSAAPTGRPPERISVPPPQRS